MSYYGKYKSNFEVFMEILEKEKNSIGGYACQDQIIHAISAILDLYSCEGPQTDGKDVTYALPEFRCAYLYLYATSHARLVCSIFNDLRPFVINTLQNKTDLRVCSIGGGPGTDFIGLLMFIQDHCPGIEELRLHGCVLDLAPQWESVYHKMKDYFDPYNSYLGDIKYHSFDLFERFTREVEEELSNCDLVIMIKFVSAVDSHKECEKRLKLVLRRLKPGALLLYIDNAGGGSHQLLSRSARQSRLDELLLIPRKKFLLAEHENTSTIRSRLSEFGSFCPQTSTIVSYGMWKKQSNDNYVPRNMKVTVKYSCSNSIRLEDEPPHRYISNLDCGTPLSQYSNLFLESSGYSSYEESPYDNMSHRPLQPKFSLNDSFVNHSNEFSNNFYKNSPIRFPADPFNFSGYSSFEQSPQCFVRGPNISPYVPYNCHSTYRNVINSPGPSLNSSFNEYLEYHNFISNQTNANTSFLSQRKNKLHKRKFMSPVVSTKVKRSKLSPMPYSKRRRVFC